MTTPSLLDTTSAQGYIYSGAYETFQYRRFVLPYDRALVSVSNRVEPDLIALGRRQTEQLLASAARPTAIFGITDLMAMGALRALK
jgi:DNA-binding LacI/PurR family transcriptional regulator